MTPRNPPPTTLLCALALALAGLAACSPQEAALPATQVAAKVGTEEISLHQINAVLAQGSGSATPEQTQQRSRAVLESLIDRQLAVEQAITAKMDRTPEVMAQLDAARREVLASAYVRQFVSTVPKPDAQEIRSYFSAHPALFAQRRVFNIQEIVTAHTPEVQIQLASMAAANRPLEEVAAWLKERNIRFTPGAASRAAEQIPLEYLARMQALQDGQDAIFSTTSSITLLRLVGSRTVPIAEAAALPRIEQFLGNQRINEAVTAQMKVLRGNTTVEYRGEFQKPLESAAAPEPAAPLTAPANTLEKGVAGLK